MIPDLETGYMVMGHDTPNRWRTKIECVLARISEGREAEYSYLSHECRAEALSSKIFDSRNYEFVAVKTWNGVFYLRGGSYNYGFNPLKNLRKKTPECVYEKMPDSNIFVYCLQRSPRYLGFDEALTILQSETPSQQENLFIEVTFRQSGFNYTLYAPGRYINYPHPELGEDMFIQPISGFVLYEENDIVHISYVATHMRKSGVESVEFRARDMVSFIETKNKGSRIFPFFNLINKMALSSFLVTDDFCLKRRFPDGNCRLFVYE